jgi:hypothetical protein
MSPLLRFLVKWIWYAVNPNKTAEQTSWKGKKLQRSVFVGERKMARETNQKYVEKRPKVGTTGMHSSNWFLTNSKKRWSTGPWLLGLPLSLIYHPSHYETLVAVLSRLVQVSWSVNGISVYHGLWTKPTDRAPRLNWNLNVQRCKLLRVAKGICRAERTTTAAPRQSQQYPTWLALVSPHKSKFRPSSNRLAPWNVRTRRRDSRGHGRNSFIV